METFKESMNIRQNQLLPGCHYRNRTERENDMSRLIDADLLMRKCEKWLKPKAPDEDEMVSVADIAVSTLMEIEEQPTAFDVENIIKQLEEERDYSYEDYENYAEKHDMDVECDDLFCRGLDRAIEIVKRGGVDEK